MAVARGVAAWGLLAVTYSAHLGLSPWVPRHARDTSPAVDLQNERRHVQEHLT
jgi:hypothetical protein